MRLWLRARLAEGIGADALRLVELRACSDSAIAAETSDAGASERANGGWAAVAWIAPTTVAGDTWLPDRTRMSLDHLEVTGRPIRRLYAAPHNRLTGVDECYDRQSRLFR